MGQVRLASIPEKQSYLSMNSCFLLKEVPIQRFNPNGQLLVLQRNAAIGDVVAASVVADKLAENGYRVAFRAHPNIHCVLRRMPTIAHVADPGNHVHVNLDGAYENDPDRRRKHFFGMFMDSARHQLRAYGVDLPPALNCRPKMIVPGNIRQAVLSTFAKYPRPWIFLNPRSESYNVRQVPDGIWVEAAKQMNGTKFWIGMHPAPPGIVDLHARHMDNVIEWLSVADLLISVDTGPLHIAAALNRPCLALGQSSSPELHLSDQSDFMTITPKLDCLNCQQNVCHVNHHSPPCQFFNPELIAQWANAKTPDPNAAKVSAVVPIYKPDVNVLNRCLSALVDQVAEVIVTQEGGLVPPAGMLQHPKVRYVQTWKRSIGFSGNANFGARHTTGNLLLFCNDDAFLAPDAVAKMLEVMAPDVGIVSNLLRYPDGGIYHAGKIRVNGERGWRHIDYRKKDPTFQGPIELENCCGCVVLVRRKAFYEAGAYDEEMPVFAQDDAFALSVRQLGYRIMFTPHSTGIHMEHQSVNKLGDIANLVRSGNEAFERRWGWYLTLNQSRVPGVFA